MNAITEAVNPETETPDVYVRNNWSNNPAKIVRKTDRVCVVRYLASGNEAKFNYRVGRRCYCQAGASNEYQADYLDFDTAKVQGIIAQDKRGNELCSKAGKIIQKLGWASRAGRGAANLSPAQAAALDAAYETINSAFTA